MAEYESRAALTLSRSQRAALLAALGARLLVITGGPGTGQTTLVRALLDIGSSTLRYLLASVFAFAPIFVANVVFSRSFRDTEQADSAFASNLLGIAIGGVVEYAALATGTQALLIPVMAFYAAALLFGRRLIRAGAAS